MPNSVIVAGARTPIGKLSGALGGFTAAELGGFAIKAALERSGVTAEQVDYVLMGQVIFAGSGQVPARQAATMAGIPLTTPAISINKACLSGLNAIYQADLMIQAGDAEIVVAGGMESMTQAPYLLPGARQGFRIGDTTLRDAMYWDGLDDALSHETMGSTTERDLADFPGVTRARMDELSAASHERAAQATKDGLLSEEIAAVPVPQRKGDPVIVSDDEGIRAGTSVDALSALRPAFADSGAITAGNSSQISDGGAAVVVMSPAVTDRLGLQPLGEIVGYGMVAGPTNCLLLQPSGAASIALGKSRLSATEIDLWEINEAFAAVVLASMDDLGIPLDIVNVNGGSVALGHPVGASGVRLALTLLHELRRRGGGCGTAALCGGGGQGDALVVRTVG